MTKPLIVYKASAGSGKTFTLATEYIKLLVRNPQSYRNILAVTFTNKATEEMKMRILSQLFGIWRGYDDSRSYLKKISEDAGISEETVRMRAGEALNLLLHNYNYFRVETIDSFFHGVLTNLARELDLTANLRLELDSGLVMEMAVDRLIDELTPKDAVMKWIMEYIDENISEDRGWNVINHIKSFGSTIFKDFYQEKCGGISNVLEDDEFLSQLKKRLRNEYEEANDRMKGIAAAFFEHIESYQLKVDDFSRGKSGVAGFFIKISNGLILPNDKLINKTVSDALTDSGKWVKKSHKHRDFIIALVERKLMEILKYGVEQSVEQYRKGMSAKETLKYLNQLRLLGKIEGKVREINEETEQFLLCNTQHILKSLISDSDSPFIFEKIGTQLEHIMIDEFQDTSTVQWSNFKVLLKECMSHQGTENLIVGDVKQSIYRWRSGDWRMLNQIETQFGDGGECMDIRNLATNFRSNGNIIEFNNAFFDTAALDEYNSLNDRNIVGAEQIRKAYSDVRQKIPEGKNGLGLVEANFISDEQAKPKILEATKSKIKQLLEVGVRQSDIAIIVRNNTTINSIAEYFLSELPEVSIVSDVAFRLDSSPAVNIIIHALELLAKPDDELTTAALTKICGGKLPESFNKNRSDLTCLPLYDMVESLYTIFNIGKMKGQSPFVCYFFDQLTAFISDKQSQIEDFLSYWDTNLRMKTIQSDGAEGIRLITIHKCKGLEYDNVIIPFCDWILEKPKSTVLWCKPSEEPYNELPIVPVMKTQSLEYTIFSDEYYEEEMQKTIDNLNLLYVAFTRASKNLFIFGEYNKNASYRNKLVVNVIPKIAAMLPGASIDLNEGKEGSLSFAYGSLFVDDGSKKKEKSENVFLEEVAPLCIEIETYANNVEFRQSNKSREFIEGKGDEEGQTSYIKIGNLLHNIFSTIRTEADIPTALEQLRLDGLLGDDTEEMAKMLQDRLSSPKVAEWFSPKWRLFTECTILSVDPDTGKVVERRPDRVMYDGNEMVVVDFKFGKKREEYNDQVREYMSLLSQMGYSNVKGFLWFVYTNDIEEVKA